MASEVSATLVPVALAVFVLTRLVLDPAQHLPGSSCGACARDSVHADQQKKLRIVRRFEHYREAIAGRTPRVSAGRCAGLHESVRKRECSMDFGASSLPRREGHAIKNLGHGGLPALACEFEVGASQA